MRLLFLLLFLYFFIFPFSHIQAQKLTSGELFQSAREAAFEEKDYQKAIVLSKEAIKESPEDSDLRIFLGRLYTWTGEVEKARIEFKRVIETDAKYEDAYFAYGNLEFWNANPEKANTIVDLGLNYHLLSKNLLFLKARILAELQNYSEANTVLDLLLQSYPNYSEARAYKEKLKSTSSKSILGITYDYIYFDKRFENPWHLASLEYGRLTKIGAVTGRFNYANRFNANGTQFELEAYPRISEVFYTYLNAGIAGKEGLFPRYKLGFSLYANLPRALEAEAGFRILGFTDQTLTYTASIGKYYQNYWFNFRTYLTPSDNSVAESFILNTRYYLAGADDYLSLSIGTGISPDDPASNVFYNSGDTFRLKTKFVTLGFRKTFASTYIGFVNLSLEDQEYLPDTNGNQFRIGIGYYKRF